MATPALSAAQQAALTAEVTAGQTAVAARGEGAPRAPEKTTGAAAPAAVAAALATEASTGSRHITIQTAKKPYYGNPYDGNK